MSVIGELKAAANESCRRVTCRCSDPVYCKGWMTCSDHELDIDEWCLPCVVSACKEGTGAI